MTDELILDKTLSDSKIYESLISQLDALIQSNEPILTGLSNITAGLKQAFNKISWVGFYLLKDNALYLGPFQGKTACSRIELGKGVCGTAAKEKRTVIVEDVTKFPGHIACDSGSKSEIVVPILIDEKVIGVLDLDSYEYNSFNDLDRKSLEQIIALVVSKFDLSNFSIN